ncbi:Ger(x)C family spore germination protein [Staphylospora marina]|uniref:Ger(x)C family spore germination protein n=1 Tax=Staphylospora marina TaxID=2490858 RepID=UPI0013DDEE1E|nr:Ger(x)C family spore germination protein [Staphylospora marina]
MSRFVEKIRPPLAKGISILLALALLPGCWDKRELNEIAIVRALGADYTENEEIELSAQQVIPQSAESGEGNKAGTLEVSGTGTTMADALSKMQGNVGRKLFLGHVEVVLFGENLARAGIAPSIDFLVRYPQLRTRSQVYVTEGNPLEILAIKPVIQNTSAELLLSHTEQGRDLSVDLNELTQMLSGESRAAVLPIVKKKDDTMAVIHGMALFDKGRMVAKLDPETARGLLWLRNEVHFATVSIPLKHSSGQISLEVIKSETTLIPRIEGNRWIMTVRIRADDDLIQNGTLTDVSAIRSSMKQLEELASKDVENRVKAALRVLQEHGTDVVGFGKVFHQKFPAEWEKMKNRWPEQFRNIELDMDVDVHVRRTGMVKQPAGVPTERIRRK